MLICKRLEELPDLGVPLHLALGVFDGVHIGHQEVISRAVRAAAKDGGLAGILTFDPHPIRVIAPEKAPTALLATLNHKAEIVRDLGIGLFIPLQFDAAFAAMEASEFIEKLCAAPVRTIAVGEDWRFGHRRSGDVEFLEREGKLRGFRLEAVPPVMLDGERVSSTRIRQAIREGVCSRDVSLAGIYHLVGGGETSWHGYASHVIAKARQIKPALGLKVTDIAPVPTASFPTPAQRPLNSRLSTHKLQQAFGLVLPPWQQGVDRLQIVRFQTAIGLVHVRVIFNVLRLRLQLHPGVLQFFLQFVLRSIRLLL